MNLRYAGGTAFVDRASGFLPRRHAHGATSRSAWWKCWLKRASKSITSKAGNSKSASILDRHPPPVKAKTPRRQARFFGVIARLSSCLVYRMRCLRSAGFGLRTLGCWKAEGFWPPAF